MRGNAGPIQVGGTDIVRFRRPIPAAWIHSTSEVQGVVTPQCSGGQLTYDVYNNKNVATRAAAPKIVFNIDKTIFPGEIPSATWRVENSCLDLRNVTVGASFNKKLST